MNLRAVTSEFDSMAGQMANTSGGGMPLAQMPTAEPRMFKPTIQDALSLVEAKDDQGNAHAALMPIFSDAGAAFGLDCEVCASELATSCPMSCNRVKYSGRTMRAYYVVVDANGEAYFDVRDDENPADRGVEVELASVELAVRASNYARGSVTKLGPERHKYTAATSAMAGMAPEEGLMKTCSMAGLDFVDLLDMRLRTVLGGHSFGVVDKLAICLTR